MVDPARITFIRVSPNNGGCHVEIFTTRSIRDPDTPNDDLTEEDRAASFQLDAATTRVTAELMLASLDAQP